MNDDQRDPNINIYTALAIPAQIVEPADHVRRRELVTEHRARRAAAQAALLRNLPDDIVHGVQVVLLEMEADAQTERHELDAEWLVSAMKAYRAGEKAGHADGYTEAVTDAQVGLHAPPEVTH